MTPVELSSTVLRAVRRAVDAGELDVGVPDRAQVTPPGPGGHGDYATNVALQLARPAGRPPHEVAAILRPHLSGAAGVTRVDITGPGFLNITLSGRGQALVGDVLRHGTRYGYAARPTGETVRLHHSREVRAAVTGQVVARMLRSQGVTVLRTSLAAGSDPTRSESSESDLTDIASTEADSVGGRSPFGGPLGPPCGTPADVTLRPVPAPRDPAFLGRDAARWALLYPAPHDRPCIGAEHLVQRESNPLFRVRYAHARSRALCRNAADLGFSGAAGDPGSSRACAARPLLDGLDTYPHALAAAARHHAPDRLARQLVLVADALLAFQHHVLPPGDEKPSAAHRARLALAEAAGTVLAGGLALLGIDAPEHL